jgi:hypothetical protein
MTLLNSRMAKGPQINDKPHLAPVTPITEIRTVASRSTPRHGRRDAF